MMWDQSWPHGDKVRSANSLGACVKVDATGPKEADSVNNGSFVRNGGCLVLPQQMRDPRNTTGFSNGT